MTRIGAITVSLKRVERPLFKSHTFGIVENGELKMAEFVLVGRAYDAKNVDVKHRYERKW